MRFRPRRRAPRCPPRRCRSPARRSRRATGPRPPRRPGRRTRHWLRWRRSPRCYWSSWSRRRPRSRRRAGLRRRAVPRALSSGTSGGPPGSLEAVRRTLTQAALLRPVAPGRDARPRAARAGSRRGPTAGSSSSASAPSLGRREDLLDLGLVLRRRVEQADGGRPPTRSLGTTIRVDRRGAPRPGRARPRRRSRRRPPRSATRPRSRCGRPRRGTPPWSGARARRRRTCSPHRPRSPARASRGR